MNPIVALLCYIQRYVFRVEVIVITTIYLDTSDPKDVNRYVSRNLIIHAKLVKQTQAKIYVALIFTKVLFGTVFDAALSIYCSSLGNRESTTIIPKMGID